MQQTLIEQNNISAMKKIFAFFVSMFITVVMIGQAPASFKYQAVLRDARGNIKANTSTNIIISILSGSATGTVVYSETHSVSTDGYGLVNLEIGNGTATTGNMTAINWNTGIYFIKTTVDGIDMGTSQLLSVPYSLYATTAGNGISTADATKLAGISAGAEVNVNADWNASSGDAQILNKPTIGNADWNASSGLAQILNKPTIANADWNASSGPAQILNKPTFSTPDGSETKINSGTNVTVTGTGTTGNPYVINTATHSVGEEYGGGIIFYVYDGGQHGLIAAKQDLMGGQYGNEPNFSWFYVYNSDGYLYIETGSKGDGLGAGAMNTTLIVASQSSYNFHNFGYGFQIPNIAAKICADYEVTVSTTDDEITFGDWYLPSRYELNLLYKSIEKVAELNLSPDNYWSSTEFDEANAWYQNFYDGTQDYTGEGNKSYMGARVRPIRSF